MVSDVFNLHITATSGRDGILHSMKLLGIQCFNLDLFANSTLSSYIWILKKTTCWLSYPTLSVSAHCCTAKNLGVVNYVSCQCGCVVVTSSQPF